MAIVKKDLEGVKKGSLISIKHHPYNGFGYTENKYVVTSIAKKGSRETFYLKKFNASSRAFIETSTRQSFFVIKDTALPAKILKVVNK